ncbi:putative transcriptional regulator PhnF [Roseivivax jejudonensis]|uniref:Putative transcriptional regulator PhnF n=1 Tax=Roseivivax jejudonensis TaxID=1529041 RepID=A0A1X6ZTJ2_9RHOB|nr:phosphonate metabolism transcriptional regulator PhnF [Roseivivax jejudonensis]SLN61157.1 putative transcriptional regulator PhnF [Roseivivax jejudonensis]
MPRTPVWSAIARTLETEIAERLYAPGAKLPTEAELAARFDVNRHTVRRALADLSERGLVRARRGAGVFVDIAPTDYPLGRRVRFHQNLRAAGHAPEKRVLRIERRLARTVEIEALRLDGAAEVIVYEGLSLSDGIAIAHFESVFPSARLPEMEAALAQTVSVTEALSRAGVADYVRADTRITAERATATQAHHLSLREGDPLLRTTSRNETPDGVPVERGSTWFAGDRVALTYAPETA